MEDEKRKISIASMEKAEEKKLKYPKSVFFIVSNEFCERFTYYGMRTILSIYLMDMLMFSESDAMIIYHTFTMLVYFFPVFGAMLADSLLGKFNTIFYVSIIYAIGSVILSLAATPPLHIPAIPFTMVGLLLIAIGTGGIKPCVSAFGGDQFVLPQQAVQLAAFFSMFYFAINSGSMVSTFLTPILRETHCFGMDHCFTLAFGVPGVLMIVSIVIFGAGKSLYIIKKPEGNMVIKVSKCIGNAIKTKSKSSEKREHWLDYATEKYGAKLVQEVKDTLRVLVLYIPLPIFWALFDQQATGWTFMARRMDGDIGFTTILPDQVQVINPLLILAFIPLFEYLIYPCLGKMGLFKKPLQRLVMGGLLAAVSFLISAGISLAIEAETPVAPGAGQGQLLLYNNLNCDMNFQSTTGEDLFIIKSLGYKKDMLDIGISKDIEYRISCGSIVTNKLVQLNLKHKETKSYFFNSNLNMEGKLDSLQKDDKGLPRISSYLYIPDDYMVAFINDEGEKVENIKATNHTRFSIKPGVYKMEISGGAEKFTQDFEVRLGAVYTFVGYEDTINKNKVEMLELTPPNGIHMLWLIPQYIVITMGEIMFSITGLEFSYSQAPTSMKSVLQACWLLTTAFGNLIVVIIESAQPFEEHSSNFFLYAGLMVVDMVIFALMAMRYKYVPKPGENNNMDMETKDEEKKPEKMLQGIANEGFTEKEP